MSRTTVFIRNESERVVSCRPCLKSDDCSLNIFVSNERCKVDVEKVMRDLHGPKVAVGGGLPSTINEEFMMKEFEFNDFKDMCLQSDAMLRKHASGNVLRVGWGRMFLELQTAMLGPR